MPTKAEHERQVFAEFAAAASLPLELVSSRQPPEPDLLCSIGGESLYFELGRLLDEGMQRLRLSMLRAAPTGVSGGGLEIRLPERAVLEKKLAKIYRVGGTPVELLLYFDNEKYLSSDVPTCGDAEWAWHAQHVMVPALQRAPGRFRRVWVFDRHRLKVLWQSEGAV